MFDDGGQALNPVAGVEVMDVINMFVGRRVDMPADDTLTVALVCKFLQLHLVLVNERHRRLHLALYSFTDGIMLLAHE